MNNPYKTIKENLVYQNKFGFSLFDNDIISPSGKPGRYMILNGADFVIIVALDKENRLIMINQWRYPVGKQILELPAGRVETDETPLETAKKELLEETGASSENWIELGSYPFLVGALNIRGHYFLAKDAVIGTGQSESDAAKSKVVIIDQVQIDKEKISAEGMLGILLAQKSL